MTGLSLISSLASNTFDIGVGVCVKGNIIDGQGNCTELVEILCARTVGVQNESMLIHVVVG